MTPEDFSAALGRLEAAKLALNVEAGRSPVDESAFGAAEDEYTEARAAFEDAVQVAWGITADRVHAALS